MKTSKFIKHFRDLCDDLEKINSGNEADFTKSIGDLVEKYGMEEIFELNHG